MPSDEQRIRRQRRRDRIERIISLAFQSFGLAAAITFGIYAPLSYQLGQWAIVDQIIATNLTLAALVEQQYARGLAEEANRWSYWAYELALAELRLVILQLCTQDPSIHVACNRTVGWAGYIPDWIETYDPYKNATGVQPSNITPPAPFTPPGYPLPMGAKVYPTAPDLALNAVVGTSFGAAAITVAVFAAAVLTKVPHRTNDRRTVRSIRWPSSSGNGRITIPPPAVRWAHPQRTGG
ncbi:hypothetical protein DL767_001334 [Monosporascus sp. MG133]|nr:hypothetical protein DL767_001334 [Monosporascus sp. MG133]